MYKLLLEQNNVFINKNGEWVDITDQPNGILKHINDSIKLKNFHVHHLMELIIKLKNFTLSYGDIEFKKQKIYTLEKDLSNLSNKNYYSGILKLKCHSYVLDDKINNTQGLFTIRVFLYSEEVITKANISSIITHEIIIDPIFDNHIYMNNEKVLTANYTYQVSLFDLINEFFNFHKISDSLWI